MYDQDYSNGDNGQQGGGGMGNDDDRKLFVGGLSWETGDADIRKFFSDFGEVESVNLKTDPNTGRSRGFAFVVFTSTQPVEAVLSAGELIISNKRVEAKRAKARTGKVFVGGIPAEVSDEEIKSHFGAFGRIAEVETPFDKIRNQRRGFVFITYESESSMKSLLSQPKQVLGGRQVDVKRATPRGGEQGGGFVPRGGMRGVPGGMGMRGGMGMGMSPRGRGMGASARGASSGRGGGGGWGMGGQWQQQQQQQQQWGGYGGAGGGYEAYGYGYGAPGAVGGQAGGQQYGYGYGDGGYGGDASGGYGGAPSGPTGAQGRGGGAGQRYQPY